MFYDFYPKLLGASKLTLKYVLTHVFVVSLVLFIDVDTQ